MIINLTFSGIDITKLDGWETGAEYVMPYPVERNKCEMAMPESRTYYRTLSEEGVAELPD